MLTSVFFLSLNVINKIDFCILIFDSFYIYDTRVYMHVKIIKTEKSNLKSTLLYNS